MLSGSRSRQVGSGHEGAATLALPSYCIVAAGEHLSCCGKAGPDSALDRGGQAHIDIITREQQILPTRLWPRPAPQLLGAGKERGPPFLDDSRRWNGIPRQLKCHGGVGLNAGAIILAETAAQAVYDGWLRTR